jgi:hypothetical protein
MNSKSNPNQQITPPVAYRSRVLRARRTSSSSPPPIVVARPSAPFARASRAIDVDTAARNVL